MDGWIYKQMNGKMGVLKVGGRRGTQHPGKCDKRASPPFQQVIGWGWVGEGIHPAALGSHPPLSSFRRGSPRVEAAGWVLGGVPGAQGRAGGG